VFISGNVGFSMVVAIYFMMSNWAMRNIDVGLRGEV
jgi:hypothetical protein